MSEVQNPFAKPVGAAAPSAAGARVPWIAAVLMTALAILFYVLWAMAASRAREAERQAEPLRAALDDARSKMTNDAAALEQSVAQVTNLQAQLADLAKQTDAVGQNAQRLEDEMRSDLESRDVTISNLQGKLTVTILDRVMFDSGEASLKPDGEAVLRKVGNFLGGHTNLKIQVIGHTDNVPIHTIFPSNWELSSARALAAVHFLTEKAGVPPERVGAVGYGEYRPIADNSTAEGRARNRRIAITILPDELAAGDAAASSHTNAPAPGQADAEK